MQLQTQIQSFCFGKYLFDAYILNTEILQQWHQQHIKTNILYPIPYWGQVWAASYALCTFIASNPDLICNKSVIELGAGLGLPSLLAAQTARVVLCSDISAEAVDIVQKSISKNKLTNCKASVLDWHKLPPTLSADVLLLSDINYEPMQFELLNNILVSFLKKGTTIILSTPQRLIAKPFIEQLQTFIIETWSKTITDVEPHSDCSVFVLKAIS